LDSATTGYEQYLYEASSILTAPNSYSASEATKMHKKEKPLQANNR